MVTKGQIQSRVSILQQSLDKLINAIGNNKDSVLYSSIGRTYTELRKHQNKLNDYHSSLPMKIRTLNIKESILIPTKNTARDMRQIYACQKRGQIPFNIQLEEIICFKAKTDEVFKAILITRKEG